MSNEKKNLTWLLMARFSIFMIFIMLFATPIFYLIITNYYAEDLIEVARMARVPESQLDLEEDTVIGLVHQVLLTCGILIVSIFLMMRLIPQKLWSPFYVTLSKLKHFRVEEGIVPTFEPTKVKEFAELNATLDNILAQSVNSFRGQKEFAENASHELQTPLAIVQAKLDLLLQDEHITEAQSRQFEEIYHEVRRMSRLNQNLLLLARINNVQYRTDQFFDIAANLTEMLPSIELLANGRTIVAEITPAAPVRGNEVLLESLISNLVVNAIRHSKAGDSIRILYHNHVLVVSNPASDGPLSPEDVFRRFYKSKQNQGGNGLGLAIVKSICDYHHWQVLYACHEGQHVFTVLFSGSFTS